MSTYDLPTFAFRGELGVRQIEHTDPDALEALFVGHSVAKVSDDHLLLDDGTVLRVVPNDGGCSCGAGDYDLTELNGSENIVTAVEAVEEDAADGYGTIYRLFVLSENRRINLFTIEGDDGNGYYGTGYWIVVKAPGAAS